MDKFQTLKQMMQTNKMAFDYNFTMMPGMLQVKIYCFCIYLSDDATF